MFNISGLIYYSDSKSCNFASKPLMQQFAYFSFELHLTLFQSVLWLFFIKFCFDEWVSIINSQSQTRQKIEMGTKQRVSIIVSLHVVDDI